MIVVMVITPPPGSQGPRTGDRFDLVEELRPVWVAGPFVCHVVSWSLMMFRPRKSPASEKGPDFRGWVYPKGPDNSRALQTRGL